MNCTICGKRIVLKPSASKGDMIVGVQCVPELDKREGK